VTAQGNTVTDEKIIAVLSLSSSAASASLGALSFVTWPTSYSVRRKGCATPLVPDGPMVSSSSDLSVISPSPGAPLCRGFFLVGFGRRAFPFWLAFPFDLGKMLPFSPSSITSHYAHPGYLQRRNHGLPPALSTCWIGSSSFLRPTRNLSNERILLGAPVSQAGASYSNGVM
jgi:hypothetical protein